MGSTIKDLVALEKGFNVSYNIEQILPQNIDLANIILFPRTVDYLACSHLIFTADTWNQCRGR